MNHPIGKFFIKNCLNQYNVSIDGKRTQGWSEFKGSNARTFSNRADPSITHTESITYYDSYLECLGDFLKQYMDWGRGSRIYKVVKGKIKKCTGFPISEKSWWNLRKQLDS